MGIVGLQFFGKGGDGDGGKGCTIYRQGKKGARKNDPRGVFRLSFLMT